jgi:hypothetical protein
MPAAGRVLLAKRSAVLFASQSQLLIVRTKKNCLSVKIPNETDLRPPTNCLHLGHHGSATRAGSIAVTGGGAIRHRGTCHHLRAVADPRRQRDSATAVFAWAEFNREECGTDLLRIESLHD